MFNQYGPQTVILSGARDVGKLHDAPYVALTGNRMLSGRKMQIAYRLMADEPLFDPLTDERIDAIFNAMPDGPSGFCKTWGYRQFARAVEDALQEKKDECRKCGGTMKPGIATGQTVSTSDEGTCSPAGPGKIIDCMKCSACGWSVSKEQTES